MIVSLCKSKRGSSHFLSFSCFSTTKCVFPPAGTPPSPSPATYHNPFSPSIILCMLLCVMIMYKCGIYVCMITMMMMHDERLSVCMCLCMYVGRYEAILSVPLFFLLLSLKTQFPTLSSLRNLVSSPSLLCYCCCCCCLLSYDDCCLAFLLPPTYMHTYTYQLPLLSPTDPVVIVVVCGTHTSSSIVITTIIIIASL